MNDIRRDIMQSTIDGLEESYSKLAMSMFFSRDDLWQAKECIKDLIIAIKKMMEEEDHA